jgi:hypothetical protein
MSDDYLWDRTGEPDPEIQQLEKVLGTLRYQPRPLVIPAQRQSRFKPSLRRGYAPALAIAATIAVILLGLGLWLGLQRRQTTEVAKTENRHSERNGPVQALTVDPNRNANGNPGQNNDRSTEAASLAPDQNQVVKPGRHGLYEKMFARNRGRRRRDPSSAPELAVNELREAEAGKVQLMLALRVASSKLNFAQKKTQGTSTENVIHNQHKIG